MSSTVEDDDFVESKFGPEHIHKCRREGCGTMWTHAPPLGISYEENENAHKCPACGTKQFRIHRYTRDE